MTSDPGKDCDKTALRYAFPQDPARNRKYLHQPEALSSGERERSKLAIIFPRYFCTDPGPKLVAELLLPVFHTLQKITVQEWPSLHRQRCRRRVHHETFKWKRRTDQTGMRCRGQKRARFSQMQQVRRRSGTLAIYGCMSVRSRLHYCTDVLQNRIIVAGKYESGTENVSREKNVCGASQRTERTKKSASQVSESITHLKLLGCLAPHSQRWSGQKAQYLLFPTLIQSSASQAASVCDAT